MAITKVKKNLYEVRCRWQGRAVRRRFTDKWDARDFEELVTHKGLNPDAAAAKVKGFMEETGTGRAPMTFRQFVDKVWLPDLVSGEAAKDEEPVTLGTARKNAQRLNVVSKYIGDTPLVRLGEQDWHDLKRTLREEPLNNGRPYLPGTANTMLKRTRQVVRYAAAKRYIERDPWQYMKLIKDRKKDKVFWRREQCEKFLETVRPQSEIHYLYFLLALNTALRKGELFGLQKRDFDFEERVIHVRRQWDSDAYEHAIEREICFKEVLKNGESFKIVPMTESVYTELRPHVTSILGDDTRLFYFGVGFMKNPSQVFRKYAREAGVPEIKAHATRDCAIGNLKRAGVAPHLIAQIAGCRIQNLVNYGHLDYTDAREAVQNISVKVLKK